MDKVTLIGLDTSKHVFTLHGVDERGQVRLRRELRRPQLAAFFGKLPATEVVLEACGSSHHKTGPDPASVVPASVPVYAGATVRPTGSLQDAARSAGRSLTGHADPYLRLLAALQTPGSPPLDYKRDVEPWLGTQAGVFLDAQGPALAAEGSRLLGILRQALSGSSAGSTAAG